MPVTQWHEIAGQKCDQCGGWATHWYGVYALCCDCHGGMLCSQDQAEEKHREFALIMVQNVIGNAILDATQDEMPSDVVQDLAIDVTTAIGDMIDIEKVYQFLGEKTND